MLNATPWRLWTYNFLMFPKSNRSEKDCISSSCTRFPHRPAIGLMKGFRCVDRETHLKVAGHRPTRLKLVHNVHKPVTLCIISYQYIFCCTGTRFTFSRPSRDVLTTSCSLLSLYSMHNTYTWQSFWANRACNKLDLSVFVSRLCFCHCKPAALPEPVCAGSFVV